MVEIRSQGILATRVSRNEKDLKSGDNCDRNGKVKESERTS